MSIPPSNISKSLKEKKLIIKNNFISTISEMIICIFTNNLILVIAVKPHEFKKMSGDFQLRIVPEGIISSEKDTWNMLVNLTDLYEFLNEYDQLKKFITPEKYNLDEPLHLKSSVFQFLNIEIVVMADELRRYPDCVLIRNIRSITGLSNLKNAFDEMDQGKIQDDNFRVLIKIVVSSDKKI